MLTLGGTAAGLVPPYLTWPLVDKVLEPYQDHVKELRSASGTSDLAVNLGLFAIAAVDEPEAHASPLRSS